MPVVTGNAKKHFCAIMERFIRAGWWKSAKKEVERENTGVCWEGNIKVGQRDAEYGNDFPFDGKWVIWARVCRREKGG